jgi:Protein of unknown function (DUF2628)
MAIYQVFAPPDGTDISRCRFVKDSPAIFAFLLPLLWTLAKRLWLVFFGILLVIVALRYAEMKTASVIVPVASMFILGLFALEARNLEAWTLARRGWTLVAIVEAGSLAHAETRFFHAYALDQNMQPGAPAAPSPPPQRPVRSGPWGGDALGLFPQPGTGSRI